MVEATWTFAVIFIAIFASLATFAALWMHSEHEAHTPKQPRPADRLRRRGSGGA